MAKNFAKFWYLENAAVANAHLYNCRDRDLLPGGGISPRDIVQGEVSFAVAEANVSDFSGNAISTFRPNRRCEWQGLELPCMVNPQAPQGKSDKKTLRPFNCIVAELPDLTAIAQAGMLSVTVVVYASGKQMVNLSTSTFEAQGKNSLRRATLV